jgi:hypothetical protein
MRWTSLLLAASALGATRPAHGEELRPVAAIVLPGRGADVAQAREVRRQLLKALENDPEVQLIDPLRVGLKDGGGEPQAYDALLERGRQRLAAGEFQLAIGDLERALARIKATLAQTRKAALSETMLYLGAAQLGAGRRGVAVRTIRELLVWRPQVATDLADAPPGWDSVLDQAREEVAQGGVGAVRVSSVPRQAEAYVDGHRLGPTPVLATNLTAGTHYLTLHLEGYQPLALPIAVEANATRTVSATLRPMPEGALMASNLSLIQTSLGAARIPELADLMREVDTPLALFVVVHASEGGLELEAYLYEIERGKLQAKTVLKTNMPPRLEELGALALWAPPREAPASAPAGPRRPWYRRWWVWSLAGAALTLVIVVPLSSGSAGPSTEQFQIRW